MKNKVYAFDFDGTLTTRDTLLCFIRYACGTRRFLWGMLLHLPLLVLMKLHLRDNGRTKEQIFTHFFGGMSIENFNCLCQRFAHDNRHLLRPEGIEAVKQAQAEGIRVCIVSASIDNWVQPFLPEAEVLGTQIEVRDGIVTGRFLTPNCYGEEKVRRLLTACPDRQSYHLTAYGDSRGDRELLRLANEAHFKPFRSASHSKEERSLALLVTLWVAVLQVLMLIKYYDVLFLGEGELTKLIQQHFHLSGFDAITYRVLTDWGPYFDVVRHPLLHWLLYPFYLLNQGLWWLTGMNCAMPITCLLLCACAWFSTVFFYRIMRKIIGVGRSDATMLTLLCFSFAYIMVTFIAPDHFALSMMLLLWGINRAYGAYEAHKANETHRANETHKTHKPNSHWPLLIFLVAGVTLTNGAKVVLAMLFAQGRKFWRLRKLLLCVLLPFALVLGASWVQHRIYVLPQQQAQQQYEKAHRAEFLRQARENHRKYKNAPWVIHKGKPIGYGRQQEGNELSNSLLRWTDMTTDRWDTTVENLFGESIQFHETHMLEDVLVYYRPVLLSYEGWWHYMVEGLLILLFLVGCWMGRRKRLLWLLLLWAAIDLTMHIGLGFAINEVYIMSAHWLFVVPLIMGFLFTPKSHAWLVKSARVLVSLLLLYLIIYNSGQLVGWLQQPILPPPFTF